MSFDNDLYSLSHTKWNCKYHIVFAQSTEEKLFMKQEGLRLDKYYDSYVNGKV